MIYLKKELTNSNIERQNILNNNFALVEIQKAAKIRGVLFENRYRFTKEMAAEFYDVDIRTIERYLENHTDELKQNGYEILKGKKLKDFFAEFLNEFDTDINVGNKIRQLSIFDFKAFLNLGMLLVESDNARILRQTILDIVIDTINQKTGGATKFINQRDEDFIGAWMQEENYRKQYTDALRDYVAMDKMKYPFYTDKIYNAISKELNND